MIEASVATLITKYTPHADATLDRIVHNAHRLELDGPSMRKIEADKNRPTIDPAQGK